ncbi:MAG: hypothetical protein Q4A83_08800 [Bacillota bacterium]|nr:hypothetical protein [Bacillota bacterium]
MKALFCINITDDKHNEKLDGEEFIIDKVTEAQEAALDSCSDDIEELKEEASLPKGLRILKYITSLAAIIGICGTIKSIGKVSFKQMFINAPAIMYGTIACAVIWGILWLYERKKNKEVNKDENTSLAIRRADAAVEACYDMLGVPDNAFNADFFMMKYKLKNGEVKPKEQGFFTFINAELKVFADEENLYIADAISKYAFPKECLTGIRTIKKKAQVTGWNKGTPYNKGEYKKYKITENQYGTIFIKPYYALQINRYGEEYELYFPVYELEVMKALTGLDVTE